MTLLVFLPPNDFRDETVATVKLFLDKWGVDYRFASYGSKDCKGTHGAVYKQQASMTKLRLQDYSGILLIDGNGVETFKLYEYRPLLDTLLQFNNERKTIAAISNSIKILARANIINGKKISMPQDMDAKRLILLFHGVPSESGIEIADNIITIGSTNRLEMPMQTLLERLGVK
jgi:putative intracellular protease/amidase